jgi:hypothetical protein
MLQSTLQPENPWGFVDWSWMKPLVPCVKEGEAGFGMPGKPRTARIGVADGAEAADVTEWAAIMVSAGAAIFD